MRTHRISSLDVSKPQLNLDDLFDLHKIFNDARLSTVALKAVELSFEEFQLEIAGEEIVTTKINRSVTGFASIWPQGKFIHHLYVAPEYQGCGFGKALLDECQEIFGLPLSLQCMASNRKACRFYERNGWVADGVTMGTDGHFVDYWLHPASSQEAAPAGKVASTFS